MTQFVMLFRLLPILALALVGCSKEPAAGKGASTEPTTPNLLANGGFETEKLDGWQAAVARGEGVVGWTEPEADEKLVHSGSRSARLGPIVSRAGDAQQTLTQSVTVSSSRLWLDGWVRLQGAKHADDGRVRAGIEVQYCADNDVVGDVFAEVSPEGAEIPPEKGVLSLVLSRDSAPIWCQLPHHTTAELQTKGLTFAQPVNRIVVTLWLETRGNAEGKAWFDDLVIKEMK